MICEYCDRVNQNRTTCEGCGAILRGVIIESYNGVSRIKPDISGTPLNEISFGSTGAYVIQYENEPRPGSLMGLQ